MREVSDTSAPPRRRSADALPEWLADLLACPRCGGDLELTGGEWRCAGDHRWPVENGVPRFVPAEQYAASFGFQWTRFSRLQLDDGPGGESERTFADKTGFRPEDVQGRTVLDVGCGMGRFTEVVSRWGGRVVGVDLSQAVDAARDNLRDRQDVAILQADVFHLPFREESFDLIFSIGVLHHTPSTREAFMRLPRLLKPGGHIAVWLYSRPLRWQLLGSEIIRPFTSRMERERLLRLVERVEPLLHRAHRVPALGRPLRVALPTSEHPDPRWRVLDTFDWYSPRYQHKHTYAEVQGWFHGAGLVEVERLAIPVSVRGVRPH